MELYVILLLVGIAAGVLGSLVGLGGGIIIVPALLFLGKIYPALAVTAQVAVGTSLVAIGVSSLSSSIAYFRQRKIDTSSALLFFAASGPGTVAGAYFNSLFSGGAFLIGFGVFMTAVSLLLMVRGKLGKRQMRWSVVRIYRDPESGMELRYGYTRPLALGLSFFVGVLAGMFGVGGGALMMPVMLLLFHFPVHLAAATSMFMIFLSSIVGSMTHQIYGNIDWFLAAALAPGAWIGGRLGAWLSTRLPLKTIVILLRIMLILTGLRLIWNGMQTL